MHLTLLGTGTSHGIPVIGCDCPVCTSKDPRNRRYRSSAFVTTNDNRSILIDCGPEFRLQALENHIKTVDSVLLTHSHADHLHGIDDLRIFSCAMSDVPSDPNGKRKCEAPPIPIYTNEATARDIKHRFSYIFAPATAGGGHAKLSLHSVDEPFFIGKTKITPVPMLHGTVKTTGWILTEQKDNGNFSSIAYLTDCNFISDESFSIINKIPGSLEHLVIDGLRIKEHATHFSFLQALQAAEKTRAKNVWLTHLTHNTSHTDCIDYLNEQKKSLSSLKNIPVSPAWDTLILST